MSKELTIIPGQGVKTIKQAYGFPKKQFKKVKKPEAGVIKRGIKMASRAALSPLSLGLSAGVAGVAAIKKAGEKVTQNRPLRRTMDKRGRFII
jgi:hypothetical protein|tara:strand:+ start:178 stop:456 length:279 start_codon:yes stop_codon:yes gene_type:complete